MTGFDTIIYVRVGNGINGTEVACNDDITPACMIGNQFSSQLTGVTTTGPGLFWLIVDGFPTPPPGPNCGGYDVNYSLL
jgi:hypothetical protein